MNTPRITADGANIRRAIGSSLHRLDRSRLEPRTSGTLALGIGRRDERDVSPRRTARPDPVHTCAGPIGVADRAVA
jgi:hypothetical protein